MDSLENQVYDIVITHFVNPNEFWYKLETNTINEKLFDLENRMQEYFLKKQHEANFNITYIPKINEIVAVFNIFKNGWIRAVVDHILKFRDGEDKYILWAIDYGIPLMSSAKFIRFIPDGYANDKSDSVFFGGLNNILPAEKVFDFKTNSSRVTITNKWSEKSIEICEEINRSYRFSFHIQKIHNRQTFGQLAITTDMNERLNIKNVLIEIDHGIHSSDNFYQILDKYQLNKSPRWLQPNGNCDLFKFNNIRHIQQSYTPSLQIMSLKESEIVDQFKQSKILQKKKSNHANIEHYIENEIEVEVYTPSLHSMSLKESEIVDQFKQSKILQQEKSNPVNIENNIENEIEVYTPSLHSMSLKESEIVDQFKQSKILQQEKSNPVNIENNIENEIEVEVYTPSLHSMSLKESEIVDQFKQSKILQQEKSNPVNIENNIENEIEVYTPSLHSMSLKESEIVDQFKQSKILQQEKSNPVNIENNIENEIEIEVNEKVKIWHEKNEQQVNKTGRYPNPNLIEKLKIYQPPRDNDSTIVPGFNLAIDYTQVKSSVSTTISVNDDKKSTVSSESDLAVVKSKRLADMKKRFKTKQENVQSKTINIPAGYDLRQLNKKKEDNKIWTLSSNDLQITRKEDNQITINSKNAINARSEISSESNMSTIINEPNKLYNPQLNYKESPEPPNDLVRKVRYSQQRINVDNTLCNVNEVWLPRCSIGTDSVLVHGEIIKPIDKMTEAKFTSEINAEMERLRINKIYRTQQYTWPHIARLNSLILVNGAKTGKTYSYLPMICSLINMQKEDGEIVIGVGPIAIIIVPFPSEAEKLLDQCRRFTKKNVLCTGERNKVVAMGDLQKNADLLISTPEGINLLMNNDGITCFNRKRMKHLIIENLNLWKEPSREILKDVFKRFKSNVQIIVTSQIWDPTMEMIINLKSLNNPLLCIGAHIEAAVYGKVNFKLKIIPKINKIPTILDFIDKHNYQDEKLVILCNNDQDVDEVARNLSQHGYFIHKCTHRQSSVDIEDITTQWNKNSRQENFILITSDDSLVQLQIQSAQNLIHYSLSTSWTRTCFRFSIFLKYYTDRIKGTVNQQPQANTLILLDEDNNEHLPKLVNFLERSNSQINSNIKKLAKQIEIDREKQKNSQNRPLCEKWLEFGKIHNKSKCSNRHLLTYVDAPPNDLPNKGLAEIHIISCESPIHYCVRILKHKINNKDNWQITRQSNEFAHFSFQMSKHFSNSNNHQIYFPILCNDLCVIKEHDKYHRGRIIEITKIKSEITKVYIKLIDLGQCKAFKTDQLLVLPDKLKEFPSQGVDLYLTNLCPYDEEESWDKEGTTTIKNWLEEYKSDDRIIACIKFSLSDIIFADELVIQEYLSALKTYNNKLYIKKNIIEKEFVKKIDEDDIELSEIRIRTSVQKLFNKPEMQNGNISNHESIGKEDQKIVQFSNSSTISSSTNSLTDEITLEMINFPPSTGQRARPRYNSRSRTKHSLENTQSLQEILENPNKHLIVKESWNMLNEKELSEISISRFYSPAHFYVQILHDAKKRLLLDHKINNFIANGAKSVEKPIIGVNCLAKQHGHYNRCKITSLNCDSNGMVANVFFCDIGSNKNCKISELRTTNSEIINSLPYQAIHCSLIGIVSKNIDGLWTDNDSKHIYNIIDKDSLFARPMINAQQNNHNILKYWKNEIILVNSSTDEEIIYLNMEIIEKGYAVKDPDTAHYLDDFEYNEHYKNGDYDNINAGDEEECKGNPIAKISQFTSTDEDCKNDNNNNKLMNLDINFTEEEMINLFYGLPNNPIKEINDLKPIAESNKNDNDNNSEIKIKLKNVRENQNDHKEIMQLTEMYEIPKLISLYKIPIVIWQQSEELICLQISAPDIKDYNLYVTNSSLIFSAVINSEMNILNLNLFGVIDVKLVSHELRGLNVIVRLLKKITGKRFSWPRLCKENDKHNWLKYNYEAIIMEHEKFENSVQPEHCIEYNSDSDSEFSENIDYEAYNKIDNPENVYDVLEDN